MNEIIHKREKPLNDAAGKPQAGRGESSGDKQSVPAPQSLSVLDAKPSGDRPQEAPTPEAAGETEIELADCFFYHTIELPEGVIPGACDVRANVDEYLGNIPLRGKTLLDVGTASGCLAFEAEKRGAEVTAFDLSSAAHQAMIPFAGSLFNTNRAAWNIGADGLLAGMRNSFWYSHKRLNSRIQTIYGSFADLAAGKQTYDVVLAGALIEHLSDPVSAIGIMAGLARETLLIASTPIIMDERLFMEPMNDWSDPQLNYTWYTLSLGLYRRVLANMGFRIARITYSQLNLVNHGVVTERPTIVAQRVI